MDLSRLYTFYAPTRLVFGKDAVARTGEEIVALGGHTALIVTDPGVIAAGLLEPVLLACAGSDVHTVIFDAVEPNPTASTVEAAIARYREAGCDCLIAVGGGSAMDAAKAAGIVIANGGAPRDYEGKPEAIAKDLPPFLCVPTTCGTGSEVTPFAVVTDTERYWKMSLASPRAIPKVAVIDPALFVKMPAPLIAATGMDALTHAIESYTNRDVEPFSDALDLHAIKLIGRYLRLAVAQAHPEAMAYMAVAATMAGIGFSQNRLGIVHAISHPVTGYVGTPHGVANAILLPYVLEYNRIGCMERLREIGEALGEDLSGLSLPDAAGLAIEAVRRLARDVGIPETLAEAGMREEHIASVTDDAMKARVNIAINPRRVNREQMEGVIRAAMGE